MYSYWCDATLLVHTLKRAKTQLFRIGRKDPWEALRASHEERFQREGVISYVMRQQNTCFLGWLLVDLDWSWQNPAYDQFRCPYQLFYRGKGNSSFSVSKSLAYIVISFPYLFLSVFYLLPRKMLDFLVSFWEKSLGFVIPVAL